MADAFWIVARDLRRLSMSSAEPHEISPSQARALRVLGRHGPIRLSELSDHLHIAARSGTEVVDALQERGLVVRSPDPHDRRAVIVELTDAGRELDRSVQASRKADADAFFGVLSATDQAALARILATLRAR